MNNKAQLRKEILLRRKNSASSAVSACICEKATALTAFKAARTIMIYLSTSSEVDTSRLIALSRSFGKQICAPRVLNDTDMVPAILNDKGFCRGAFGIWEPIGPAPSSIDLIFVPGVVFDKAGNRIGYGKGYYDRFLQEQNGFTVGLAYTCQIVSNIPAAQHDIRLDMILTEKGVLT